MSIVNTIEERIVPEVPKVLDQSQLYVYVPIATVNTKGIASFNDDDFNVLNGRVSIDGNKYYSKTDVDQLVQAEQERATEVEETLDGKITLERNRAMAVETALGTRVSNNEVDISNLETRMDTAEGDIDTAQADITANSQAIANEVTARQTADTAETTARENADTLLSGRIGAIEQTVGNESIAEIAPTITAALNSLNEDVDALQSGVVPRINRGIIEYSAPTIVPSAELVALMNAKILELFNRTPNNTDKLTVRDTDGENIGTYYTYNYWLGFTEVTDGWYWDSISVTAPINETPSYSQNVLTTSWGTAVNGMYNIEIPSTTHGQGTDNKITVEFKLLNTSGTYEPIQLYNVSGSGTVTLYTDTPFSGIVVIKAGTATYLTESTFEESQVVGLVGDLTAIRGDITALESDKQDKLANVLVINSQTDFDAMLASANWLGANVVLINTTGLVTRGRINVPTSVGLIKGIATAGINGRHWDIRGNSTEPITQNSAGSLNIGSHCSLENLVLRATSYISLAEVPAIVGDGLSLTQHVSNVYVYMQDSYIGFKDCTHISNSVVNWGNPNGTATAQKIAYYSCQFVVGCSDEWETSSHPQPTYHTSYQNCTYTAANYGLI